MRIIHVVTQLERPFKRCRALWIAALLAGSALAAGTARADDVTVVAVTIRDHRFDPAEIRVPAGKPVRLDIRNEDPTAEEFDSRALKVEKVIGGKKSGSVRIRPLDRGSYPFIGEYHSAVAKGVVVAE